MDAVKKDARTEIEQRHIAAALTFELSKVETVPIRAHMVAHLLNIEKELAHQVADGLRLKEMPQAVEAAKPTHNNLPTSPALSMLRNTPTGYALKAGHCRVKTRPTSGLPCRLGFSPTSGFDALRCLIVSGYPSYQFPVRKVGVLVTDGVDIDIFHSLKKALAEEGAQLEVVAPRVGGVEASDGSWIDAAQQVDGGSSILYDAVPCWSLHMASKS